MRRRIRAAGRLFDTEVSTRRQCHRSRRRTSMLHFHDLCLNLPQPCRRHLDLARSRAAVLAVSATQQCQRKSSGFGWESSYEMTNASGASFPSRRASSATVTSALLASGSSRSAETSSAAPLCWSPTTAVGRRFQVSHRQIDHLKQTDQVGRTHLQCEPFSPARGPRPPVQACCSMPRPEEGTVPAVVASHAGGKRAETSEVVGTESRTRRACGGRGAVPTCSAVSRCTLRVVRVSAASQAASEGELVEVDLAARRRRESSTRSECMAG